MDNEINSLYSLTATLLKEILLLKINPFLCLTICGETYILNGKRKLSLKLQYIMGSDKISKFLNCT